MKNFNVNCNNSIQIIGSKKIYIDPYEIEENLHDADYIFCTHSHYDHFSENDLKKVIKESTKIITVKSSEEDAEKLVKRENILIVEPNKTYKIDDIEFSTTYAYNVNKPFHPKQNNWVGFIINLDGIKYFISGDTDNIDELQGLEADYAFIPVGGTYTMDYKEAAELANNLNVKAVIPTHYGSVAGSKEDGNKFKMLVKDKEVIEILYK